MEADGPELSEARDKCGYGHIELPRVISTLLFATGQSHTTQPEIHEGGRQ